jgi:hypothetical protein
MLLPIQRRTGAVAMCIEVQYSLVCWVKVSVLQVVIELLFTNGHSAMSSPKMMLHVVGVYLTTLSVY